MTTISDERLAERAETKLRERAGFMRDAGHIDDAELDEDAANLIQSLRAQGGVRVKPLEWEVYGVDIWEFSSYPNPYLIGRQSGDGRFWVHHRIVGDLRGSDGRIALHGAANDAKAAAQADYERRIMGALA